MLKKLFIICSLILLLGTSVTYAQNNASECKSDTEISSNNYPICCPSNLPGLSERCTEYITRLCTSSPNHPLCSGNTNQTTGGGNTNNNTPQNFAQCNSNTEVSTNNYPICCPSNLPGLSERCTEFIVRLCTAAPGHALCVGNSNGTVPQQIGGIPTGPVNGDDSTEDYASRNVSSDKSQYSNITTCDGIKLNSALNILIWAKCVIIAAIIPLIFALAFMFFLIGVFRFMTADTTEKKKNGQHLVWWGLLGLFVMVSVWGIIKIAGTVLGTGEVVPFLQTDYLSDKNKTP